jgi:hypothetical protein
MTVVTIIVLIIGNTGTPIAGIEVAFAPDVPGVGGQCVTGDDGRCSMDVQVAADVEAPIGTLILSRDGQELDRMPYGWRGGQSQVGPIEVRLSESGQAERGTGVEATPAPVPTSSAGPAPSPTVSVGATQPAVPTVTPAGGTPSPTDTSAAPEVTPSEAATEATPVSVTPTANATQPPATETPPGETGSSVPYLLLIAAGLMLVGLAWFFVVVRREQREVQRGR